MSNMKQEVMESLQPDYIFLDEMHRALAKEWSKGIMRLLEIYPNAKVLGLSATPIRYLDKCRNVVEELFGGNLACDMSLSQAILDGILPMARYVCGVYSFQKDEESLNKKIEQSCNSEEEKQELLKQVKVLKENLDKGHGVSDIFRKYIMSGNEKFVVFLKDTKHLRVMKPVIEKWFTDAGFSVRMYEVHCKNADRDKEFQKFKEDTEIGVIKACLSVNMVTEGIHGDIDGVIMLRDTISPNMYFQMIGRAFACGKKTIPLIFDLVANSQFISGVVDNFPNELRGEIKKRKEECEKEGRDYEVGFDVDEFIVMDEFMDAVSGFRAIEERLEGDWENGLKHFDKYVREHDGDVLVPGDYRDEDGFFIGKWVSHRREEFKKDMIGKDKIMELNKHGFIWDVNELSFDMYIKALKRYLREKGNCLVPSNYVEFIDGKKLNLGQWCRNIRRAKKANDKKVSGYYLITKKREKLLEHLNFVWDVRKYKFEENVKSIAEYYMEYRKYPSVLAKDPTVKQLGHFIVNEKSGIRKNNYPKWKREIFNQYLPDFSCETNSNLSFSKFIYYVELYKERYNHLNIKVDDMIDGYKIGMKLNTLKQNFKKGQLSQDKVNKINELGISLMSNSQNNYKNKMQVVKHAIKNEIIINRTNKIYNGVNLYDWIITTVKRKYKNGKIPKEDIGVIEKLLGKSLNNLFCDYGKDNKSIKVKVKDLPANKIMGIFDSLSEASRKLGEINDINIKPTAISKRLNGEITTPYKGRFMFYYATDEEVKKYLEDGKLS